MFVLMFLTLELESSGEAFSLSPDEVHQLIEAVTNHKWLVGSAILIGLLVRLLKSDTKIPIDIPGKYRVWAALGLGVVSGVVNSLATNKPWLPAFLEGVASAGLAIVGQNAFIESLRGGKELVIPGLIKPGVPPAPGKPASIDPPPMPPEDDDSVDTLRISSPNIPAQRPLTDEDFTPPHGVQPKDLK